MKPRAHPALAEDAAACRRLAGLMLRQSGRAVSRVWAVDEESIAYTCGMSAFTARLVPDERGGWRISEVVEGWGV